MTERWKYQIKTGGFWGIFMTVFNILFELKQVSFLEQISKPTFYIRLVGYVIVGIFVLGYFNWKAKLKKEGK
jgi:hypothetical protein